MKPTVLVVEDERLILCAYSKYLTQTGFDVVGASSLNEARGVFNGGRVDAVLLDRRLPDGDGLDLLTEMRRDRPKLPIVVITAETEVQSAVEAMRRGADDFLTKPVSLEDLNVFLRKKLQLSKGSSICQRPEPYFGDSLASQRVVELMKVAAQSDAPVALYGETGTGKGLVARWIHDHSRRGSAPFVEVNCSSLRGELLASELFGHSRGAFTSAVKDQQGLLGVADGGTLFLDEIGDMDLEIQARILKVIEEKRYRPVGEVTTRRSEFRLICATNHDLERATQKGRFRRDLFFRLQVFPLELPTLLQRRTELHGLARHLLGTMGFEDTELEPQALRVLAANRWPGNIRELRNVLQRAVVISRGSTIQRSHLIGVQPPDPPPSWRLQDNELTHIQNAIRHFKGDAAEAARALGVSLPTLYRKLRTLQADG
jgi:DNA-binding NtrC family response regulator